MLAVARRPALWGEGLRTLVALAPRGWWKRSPFLPVPDESYARWRIATSSGDPDADIQVEELISYLQWRRGQHS